MTAHPISIAPAANPQPFKITLPAPPPKLPEPPPIRLVLSRLECADALGISARTVDAMVKNGELPFARIGSRVTFPVGAMVDWLAARTVPARTADLASDATAGPG